MVVFHADLHTGSGDVASALTAAQQAIRALSPADALEGYERLGGDPTAPLRWRCGRDLDARGGMPVDPAHPFHWAPFIHLGS